VRAVEGVRGSSGGSEAHPPETSATRRSAACAATRRAVAGAP